MKPSRSGFAFLAAALLCVPSLLVAQQTPPAAPVPGPILTAHKIFIANGGDDANALLEMKFRGRGQQTYGLFYSAMEAAGQWQLVNSPQGADLVLVVRLTQSGSDLPQR